MKFHTFLVLVFGALCRPALWAQADLSGVVNDYAAVQSIDTCLGTLTLAGGQGAFAAGDRILVMQMQGATINESNSTAFGDVSALGSAGLYEVAQVADVQGAVVSLQYKLVNTYNPAGRVQIVRVPVVPSAVVSDTLRCTPWNGTTGGVLALVVEANLTLNAPIDVSRLGFRGGVSEQLVSECSAFTSASAQFYGAGDWRGAPKGEGIAIVSSGKENGRGAQANGGGGGNDHNAGGGGGGNIAKGGVGGLNDEPYFLNCSGDFPGSGSKTFSGASGRIFMGGGGGAGHRNNNNNADGGNGGGIVMLIAGTLQSNGHAIKANGASAATVKKDGGGGGGGGGTVVLLAGQLNDALTISASGGNGGLVNNQNDERCFGPGGGGGGGQIWSSNVGNPNLTTSLIGGTAGITFNSLETCNNTSVGAANGENGNSGVLTALTQSTQPWQQPAIVVSQPQNQVVCLSSVATFTVGNSAGTFSYQWFVDDGTGFAPLTDGGAYSGTATGSLQVTALTEDLSGYVFQCAISAAGDCFPPVVSQQAILTVLPSTVAAFSYTTNLTVASLTANQQTGTTYTWNINGETFNGSEVQYDFQNGGNYTVTLTASGDCNTASTVQIVTVSVAPTATFSAANTAGCAPNEVVFANASTSGNYLWLFEGGTPSISTDANPTVTYTAAGAYDVTLIVSNDFGSDTLALTNYVNINVPPNADFSVNTDVYTVNCVNTSTGGNSYLWGFGDGGSSSAQSPTYTYPTTPGDYIITLTVSNECGSDISSLAVTVGQLPSAAINTNEAGGCAPFTTTLTAPGQYVDTWYWATPGATPPAAASQNITLTYEQPGIYDVSLTVSNASGSVTYNQPAFIEVLPFPDANFTLVQSGNTIYCTNLSTDGNDYFWNFGDGTPVISDFSPSHTYQQGGNFVITLTAANNYCADSYSLNFDITATETTSPEGITLSPQPTATGAMLQWPTAIATGTLQIFDAAGRQVQAMQVAGTQHYIHVADYPSGMYFLSLRTDRWQWSGKLVKQ